MFEIVNGWMGSSTSLLVECSASFSTGKMPGPFLVLVNLLASASTATARDKIVTTFVLCHESEGVKPVDYNLYLASTEYPVAGPETLIPAVTTVCVPAGAQGNITTS
jgi:hypothetical protein